LSAPRNSHSLLKLIVHLANARHLEAIELATILADAGNPDRRPLLRASEKPGGEVKFEVLKVSL